MAIILLPKPEIPTTSYSNYFSFLGISIIIFVQDVINVQSLVTACILLLTQVLPNVRPVFLPSSLGFGLLNLNPPTLHTKYIHYFYSLIFFSKIYALCISSFIPSFSTSHFQPHAKLFLQITHGLRDGEIQTQPTKMIDNQSTSIYKGSWRCLICSNQK